MIKKEIKKEYVTWQMVDDFCDMLVSTYWNTDVPGVYGIPRGGSILAVIISHRLHIPMLASPVAGCLIVDDICDTGESLLHYIKNSSALNKPIYRIATMYYKENQLGVKPDIYGYNKEDKWTVFPWEDLKEV
jgi:hypoxanthine phosphoribosyltransferase